MLKTHHNFCILSQLQNGRGMAAWGAFFQHSMAHIGQGAAQRAVCTGIRNQQSGAKEKGRGAGPRPFPKDLAKI
jgi:hypothetical protein